MIPTLTSRVIGFEEGERGGVRVEKRLFRAVSPIFCSPFTSFLLQTIHEYLAPGAHVLPSWCEYFGKKLSRSECLPKSCQIFQIISHFFKL